MKLVQAAERAPELQAQLRDVLNMARDADKWRNLTRMLAEKVCAAVCALCVVSCRPRVVVVCWCHRRMPTLIPPAACAAPGLTPPPITPPHAPGGVGRQHTAPVCAAHCWPPAGAAVPSQQGQH
jgi:hypothetical protein